MLNAIHRPISAVWNFRHFILGAVKGEFKSRVARSKIGTFWFILHPLAMALIYALVLSEVLGAKIGTVDSSAGYAIYLLAGLTAWTFFSEVLNRCIGIFIEYRSTLKKINFPRLSLPVIVLSSALINQVLLVLAVTGIIAFYGFFPNVYWIFMIPLVLIMSVLALGIGVLLGVLNVFARDVAQVMMVVMNLWFWLTPIVYTVNIIPDTMNTIVNLNPMWPIVSAYHDIILYGTPPDLSGLLYPLVLGVVLIIVSYLTFRRADSELVDAL